jgi:hypothetical protein
MISLFGGRPDHPMADLKAAKRILAELPAQEQLKALDELASWMESVSAAEGFRPEQRIRTLLLIDETAYPRVRRLARDYLSEVRPSRVAENRMWTAIHGYYRQAGQGFARTVERFVGGEKGTDAARPLLPLLLVRTLRSLAQQVKWMHLRYGPIDLAVWGMFNGVFAFAEARQAAQPGTPVYPGVPGESSAQLEFLKGAMFSASAPDALLPLEAEIAERLIGELAPRFAMARTAAPALPYWVDIGRPMTPQRLSAPPAAPGVRCFGPGEAYAELESLRERVRASRSVPPELNLGASYEAQTVVEVIEHLLTYWSPHPPPRKFKRHAVKTRLSVSHGFDGLLAMLGAGGSLDFGGVGGESWIVENVSAGGFGAVVPQLKGDWLRVGALIAMQPEGGTNWLVGLVRRVHKTSAREAQVGIETLSKAPMLAQFGVSGVATAHEQGVLLRDSAAEASEARVLLRPGIYAPTQNLEADQAGRTHIYMPQGIAERGEDYEIARFREMIRES